MRLLSIALVLSLTACGDSAPVEEPGMPPALYEDGTPDGPQDEPAADDAAQADDGAQADEHADAAPTAKININTADEDALKAIPGSSDRMAHEFEEYRPYVSITQFRAEIGKYVDEATVAGYEEHIYVPIQINDCDAATLMQIPGVSAETAEALIAGRPFASKDEFTTMLEAIGSNDAAHASVTMLAE